VPLRPGYTRIFENMIMSDPNITVRLNVDFFELRDKLPKAGLTVFTGPIDAYYASQGLPKLEYRSLRFFEEYHEPAQVGAVTAVELGVCKPFCVCV
jgi:UDP-galactopyranose mutase